MEDGGTGGTRRGASSSRQALKRRLFQKCDKDRDGFLNKAAMRELAEDVGFEGSEEDWTEEYQLLCAEHHLTAEGGIPENIIMNVLEDKSELGLYCTDQEIRQLLGDDAADEDDNDDGEDEDDEEDDRDEDDADDTEFVRIFFAGRTSAPRSLS
jgi:hypothetical protein